MDDARRIENLLHTYAERFDSGDLDGVAELFTYGRIVRARGKDAAKGRAGVRAMYDPQLYEDGTPRTKHVTTNSVIDVAEGASIASARSYFTVFQQTPELPLQPIIAGRYHDTFHTVSGEWWFDARRMFVDLVGDLSHHLRYEFTPE